MLIIDKEPLKRWISSVFETLGVSPQDAAATAGVLTRTNLRAIDSHGVSRVPSYVDLIQAGLVNPAPSITMTDRDGMIVFDADRSLGQALGLKVTDHAIELARTRAMVGIVISHVAHLGALGMFALHAAEAGFIAVMVQNTSPIMGLPGALQPVIGNNPFAFAAPRPRAEAPLVFDMATSEAAYGKILAAARANEPIPEGWALDSGGRPTTDPAAALRGLLLPSGGHKGIGLAMLVECLAGSLSGVASRKTDPSQPIPPESGAFLMVVNPDLVIGRDAFDLHMDGWLGLYGQGGPDMRYPGQRAAETEKRRSEQGIPLPETVVASLRETGAKLAIPFPAAQ